MQLAAYIDHQEGMPIDKNSEKYLEDSGVGVEASGWGSSCCTGGYNYCTLKCIIRERGRCVMWSCTNYDYKISPGWCDWKGGGINRACCHKNYWGKKFWVWETCKME